MERPVGQSVGTTLHATAQNATTFAWSKVSGPNSVQLGDTTSKDLQLTFTDLGTYVFRIRASNGSLYAEDDVQVTVTPPNTAPTVTINPKYRQQTITLPTNTVNLSANITDDGHPKSSLVSVWKCKSGPACAGVTGVTFSNKRKTFTSTPVSGIHDTVVTFPATPGLYKIRIVANDGALKAQRIVTVTVQPQVARPPSTKRISDDGADPQALSIDGPLVAWGDTRHLVPYSQPATPGDIYLYDAERPVEPRVMWISQIAFGERPFVSDNNRIVWVNNAPTGVEALYICTYNREAGTCPPQLILPAPRSSPDVPTMSGNRIVYLGNSFFINDHGYKDTAEDIYTCAYDPRTNQCPEQRLTDFRDGFPINDEVEVEGSRLVFPYRIGGTTNKNIFTCLIPGSGQCSPIPLTTSNNAWQPSFDGNRAVWLAGNSVSLYDFSNPNRPALPLPLSRGAKWADISGDRVIWAAGSGIFLYRISTGQTQQVLTRPNMAEYYTGQISGERIVWFEYNSNTKRSEIWMHDLGTAP
ncbi:MAG: hypothetical protein HY352_02345 [Candidatus Omnitrophica bacterium]|nr:hypothetical protein [Candidatus Omnitrophota bacterium]